MYGLRNASVLNQITDLLEPVIMITAQREELPDSVYLFFDIFQYIPFRCLALQRRQGVETEWFFGRLQMLDVSPPTHNPGE